MTLSIPGMRSVLVHTDRDGKHVPASHPALKRREPWLPKPPVREPEVVIERRGSVMKPLSPEERAAMIRRIERREAHAAYKRERYHTDPEYRARHLARVKRLQGTPEGRALKREYDRRYRRRRYGSGVTS